MARGHARRARDKFELLTRWGDVFGSLSLSAHDPVEAPAVGDALKLVLARVLEREARQSSVRSFTVWSPEPPTDRPSLRHGTHDNRVPPDLPATVATSPYVDLPAPRYRAPVPLPRWT